MRVYPVPGRSSGWLAFLYGPLRIDGNEKTAFVLTDLRASTLNISGHDQTLHGPVPVRRRAADHKHAAEPRQRAEQSTQPA